MSQTEMSDAVATATKVVEIFVDDSLKALPLPETFWNDAYVLGFLMCAAIQMTQGRYGDALQPIDAAEAAFRAIAESAGRDVQALKDRVGVFQNEGDRDYLQAMLAADKLVRYVTGSAMMDADPVIVAARERTAELIATGIFGDGTVSEEAAVRATLLTTLFTDVVHSRFGLSPDTNAQ